MVRTDGEIDNARDPEEADIYSHELPIPTPRVCKFDQDEYMGDIQ